MSKKTKTAGVPSKNSQAASNKVDPLNDFALVCGQDFFPVPVDKLRPHPEVKGFYPIIEEVLEGITAGIRKSGFDRKFPLQVCRDGEGGYYVWDGLTRCAALGRFPKIKEVPAIITDFKSSEDLFMAVIKTQGLRRKMTDPMLLKSVEKIQDIEAEKAKRRQGHRNDLKETSPQDCGKVRMSANKAIGLIVGKSEKTIEHAKAVLRHPDLREIVLKSELTLNQAFEKLSAMNKPVAGDPDAGSQESSTGNTESPAEAPPTSDGTAETLAPEDVQDKDQLGAKTQGKSSSHTVGKSHASGNAKSTKNPKSPSEKGNAALVESVETVPVPVNLFRLLRDKYPTDTDALDELHSEAHACGDAVIALLKEVPSMAKALENADKA